MPLILKSGAIARSVATGSEPTTSRDLVSATANRSPHATRRTLTIDELPTLLREAEVAAYLSIPAAKLRRMGYEGTGPKYKKVGREHLYRRDDLRDWLDS